MPPMVQILDAPVPQLVEQLPDVFRFFDLLLPVPEQVIEVPKILLDDVPVRAVLRDPQLVEQLVEVPTIVTYSWLQLRMEQNVDIPAPGRGGRISGLQGFLPEQSSTAWHAAQERSSERIVEQIVDSRAVGGGLQEFRPGQGSSASSSFSPGHAGEGVFRTFLPNQKSAKWSPHSGSELCADFTSSTPAAQLASNSWYDVELDQTWLRFVWPLLLVSAQNGPLPMGAPVGAKTVKVPQIQFQFSDRVVVVVGCGAAAHSRRC